jgi:hypothetical protein
MNKTLRARILSLVLAGFVGVVVGGAAMGVASANRQPNMHSALDHLHKAKDFLQRAEHNKGGWRAAALSHTETAISETKRGIAFAN